MSESKQGDGGPAFPTSITADGPFGGMSLRDWFAGQVLAGECASQMEGIEPSGYLATRAYAIADAMLSERAKATRHE